MKSAIKISLLDIEKYEGFNLVKENQQELFNSLTNQIESEIKKRIAALGVDINDTEFIKINFEFIEQEGDEFKHLFYRPEKKFILSIQKVPSVKFAYDGEDYKNNKVTCTCEYKFY